MQIVENLIEEEYYKYIKEFLLGDTMPWYWNESTVTHAEDIYQFTYSIIHKEDELISPEGWCLELVAHIIKGAGLQNAKVTRAKLNLLPRQPYTKNKLKETKHQDTEDTFSKTILYYLNDSDGDTVFYNEDGTETYITPKANTAVIFNSNIWHRSTPPRINKKRVVLNVMYIDEDIYNSLGSNP